MTSLRAFEGGERYPLPGLAAFCAALLPPEAGGPDPRALAADVERFAAKLPARARAVLRAGVSSLAASAVLGRGIPDAPSAGAMDRAVSRRGIDVHARLAADPAPDRAWGGRDHARQLRDVLPASRPCLAAMEGRASVVARRP